MVETLKVPENDRLQVVTEHPAEGAVALTAVAQNLAAPRSAD